VPIINHFGSLPLDHASGPDDLFGNAYEYKRLRKLDDFVSQRRMGGPAF
jgi:hypothetical protein